MPAVSLQGPPYNQTRLLAMSRLLLAFLHKRIRRKKRQKLPTSPPRIVQQRAVSMPARTSIEKAERDRFAAYIDGRISTLEGVPDLLARRTNIADRVDEEGFEATLDDLVASLAADASVVFDRVSRLVLNASVNGNRLLSTAYLRAEADTILRRAQARWAIMEDRFVAAALFNH